MYAAAGGASLASRQARQKQRKQNLQQQKNQKVEVKQPVGKQFHQNYTETKVKLSRVERNALRPPPLQPESRRHSTSLLKEPSRARIKESPSVLFPIPNHLNQSHLHATPSTLIQEHATSLHPSCSIQSQLPQILIPEGDCSKLERRCSFVRQVEEMEKCHEENDLDHCNHICNYDAKEKPWDNNLTYFSEFHRSAFGSLDYPFSECSQGRAAWQERQGGRRCSLSEDAHQHRLKQVEAHHRWMKRNRIHDTSYGGESEEDIFAIYHQSAAANALLYVGLGTTAIGSVVFFVGSGDKGFKTLELRLIGPTLVACGLLCCLIRVLLCACPSTCIRRRKKTRLKNACPHNSSRRDYLTTDPSTSLISKSKKRVSIAQPQTNPPLSPPPPPIPSTSTAEDLPRCQKYPNIPTITIPDFFDDCTTDNPPFSKENTNNSIIEMENLEFVYDLESITSGDSDSIVIEHERGRNKVPAKLTRTRVPVHSVVSSPTDAEETCLSVVVERGRDNSEKISHSGILLSPLQLEQ